MPKFAILYSENLKQYDLGHVLTQDRYQAFIELFQQRLGHHSDFQIVPPPYASVADLRLIHTDGYIKRIEICQSKDPLDTPLSPGLVRGAKLLSGAGKLAGELVQTGKYRKAFVVGGGVQHATRNREKGFGVFSDVGICAENLRKSFDLRRILILDTDAHAGDGIYEIFSEDPQVLFISIHQDPLTIYPGRGFGYEIGKGAGEGYSVNVPLPPGSGDGVYEYVLKEIFVPLAEEFVPEIILMVDGSDPHFTDRITQMGLTLEGIKMVGKIVRQTADKICDGKVIDFIGSGYSSNLQIVSLGWLASIAGVTGTDLDLKEPQPIHGSIKSGHGLGKARRIVRLIQNKLSPYWRCLAD